MQTLSTSSTHDIKTVLGEIIKKKIQNEGAISFRDYMEMALYYPDLGYYSSQKEKVGKKGDFLTSPEFSPIFGILIGRQLEEMWDTLKSPRFSIVEYGAGTGTLCHDVLNYFKNSDRYENLDYYIIEKSPTLKAHQQKRLTEKVKWVNCISQLEDITGCVISNEVVDNFSVHKVIMNKGLKEVYVTYQNTFKEQLSPIAIGPTESLENYLRELKVTLPEGHETEINLEAIDWMKQITNSLKKGYVMTIDYGYPSSELYSNARRSGTLACYHNHQVNYLPYSNIGEQDITAHVNFSALCLWGFKFGLQFSGFRTQRNFLLALGFNEYLKNKRRSGLFNTNWMQEEKNAGILIEEMGNKFKVLVQHKNVEPKKLQGFDELL
jgi:SAM-dependent MidA family methyltransferase